MPDRPELLTFFTHRHSVYNVLPDVKAMTWGIWDRDGWIGELTLRDGAWRSQAGSLAALLGPFATSAEAIVDLLSDHPPQTA